MAGGRFVSVLVDVVRTLRREVVRDHALMIAAGLAYYAVFGLLPALAAAAALIGLSGGFQALESSSVNGGELLPQGMGSLMQEFVTGVPEGFGGGVGLLVNLAVVVVTSQRAASGLITALNIIYDVTEHRHMLRRASVALAVGVVGIALLFVALILLILPTLSFPGLDPGLAQLLRWLRWPVLALLFTLGLGLLFRYAPSRKRPKWRTVAAGAITAALLWLAASTGVSIYVAHAGTFGKFYGSLGSAAIVLLWFYFSALAMLAGAETDAVLAARADGRPPSGLKSELRRRERAPQDA